MNCVCCLIKKLTDAIKNINVSCDIPQPLEVAGNVTSSLDIPQPLQIAGDVNCNVPQPLNVSVGQPVEITGTITCTSSGAADPCTEAMIKILSQSNSFNEIVFKNDEQFQKVEDVTVDNYILSFSSQGQKIQAPVCNVEYVVL